RSDISHVLASIFKDVYTKDIIGKDTLSNLLKTKTGKSSYHDRYVEELQQAHSEYNRCIKEADMLESHIIQARAQAAATEREAYERLKERMEDFDNKEVPVKSAFTWCVDNDLLEINNLIAPRDYLTIPTPKPPPRAEAPADFIFWTNYSSLKLDSCIRSKYLCFEKSHTYNIEKPSAKDRAEGRNELQKLKDRHRFLRNPRFLPPNTQQGGASLIRSRTKEWVKEHDQDPIPVFLAKPPVVFFTDYSVGHVYETTLELKNLTSSSRHVRVIPPTTAYFSIGLGRFPGEGGIVAPGLSCKYTVRFAPDSLADFEDFIVVETQAEHLLLVPIEARRPPPVLTLPRVLDCGYCLIGGVKFVEFLCQNVGLSTGTFWNPHSVSRTYFSEQPPFAVSPSLFVLQPGEATVVEVVFFPTRAEKSCQVFTVVCDNCQVKDISVEGVSSSEGQLIALELLSVSGERECPAVGEVHDLTAEHFVRFNPCNPHAVQQKRLVIRNNVHLELPFHWQIMKPNVHPLLPGETPEPSHIQFHPTTDDVFHVTPLSGLLAPCQNQEFLLTFIPKEV
uniref:DLEC1 cilia and flagella associated protein n=1 Tax=Sphaeramia orbicularis TaxID=375764 RepID=A0A673CFH2_9TELE